MSLFLSMAAFALASSITPGPVNVVALGCGARHGFLAGQRHVAGATVGFTLLLLLIGLGLHRVLEQWPFLTQAIHLAGVAFLFYLAARLVLDDGRLGSARPGRAPSFFQGAAMQWLNPKAWLASVAGMGAFAADGSAWRVWQFAVVYFLVCYVSIACWVYVGTFLRAHLRAPGGVRLFNRLMALLLVACALYLLS